ncbi:hypothetical protein NDU88_006551 [Pleurodeles waltl]|uniref:Uncharacterized protein n=1 Tax=Pleurodeles waltl TaxID=8319 RepID=A0AAV7NTL9_PLEWA|nr:hypothetical protein NDU88_006551 [Pleurodeles waltl]
MRKQSPSRKTKDRVATERCPTGTSQSTVCRHRRKHAAEKPEEDTMHGEKGDADQAREGDGDQEEEGDVVKQEESVTREEEENVAWDQDESTIREEEERATGKDGTEDRIKGELISKEVKERAGGDAGGTSHM